MSALYVMKFAGTANYGFGVLYIGKGHVLVVTGAAYLIREHHGEGN